MKFRETTNVLTQNEMLALFQEHPSFAFMLRLLDLFLNTLKIN